MKYLIIFFSLFIGIRCASYGYYEIKKNSNVFGGITVILIAIICVLFPNIVIYFRGI